MASIYRKLLEGLRIVPKSSTGSNQAGDLEVLVSDNKLRYYDGSTNAIVPTVSSNDVLTNKTLTNPTINAAALSGTITGSPTFSGNLTQESTSVGGNIVFTVKNDDTSNTASNAISSIIVGGTGAGDPKINYTVSGGNSWGVGIDNSDSDKYKVSLGGTLGTNDALSLDGSLNASFGGAVSVSSTSDSDTVGNAALNSAGGISAAGGLHVGKSGTATGGQLRYRSDDGNTRWVVGLPGSAASVNYFVYDNVNAQIRMTIDGTTGNATFGAAVSGSNLSGTNTGDVTVTAIGSSPNANAASLSGQALTLQPCDATNPGIIAATTQTIPGPKTFTSNSKVEFSSTGATVSQTIKNTETANSASSAALVVTVGGTSAGDALATFNITSGESWAAGADNSDSDKFKISHGTALGTNDALVITADANLRVQAQLNLDSQGSISHKKTDDNSSSTPRNNLNAANISFIRFLQGPLTINGITTGWDGQRLVLANASGSSITVTYNSGSATGQKIWTPNNADLTIRTNGAVELIYDQDSAVWRAIAP